MTRVSIITATLNRLEMLQQAVANVKAQRIKEIEHLIADGGSIDGTRAWVGEQPDLILLKGPDRGVYDAWNRALAKATGDVIGFLNSDDLYFADAIADAVDLLEREPGADAVVGAQLLEDGDAIVRRYDRPNEVVADLRTLFLGHVGINGHFFRRRCFQELGEFSLNYPLSSDRDWMIRFVDRGFQAMKLDRSVYRYRRHAGSLTFDHGLRNQQAIRSELLALAYEWQNSTGASAEARRLARVLEGRSRISLARLAIHRRDSSLLHRALSRWNGKTVFASIFAAVADYLVCGK